LQIGHVGYQIGVEFYAETEFERIFVFYKGFKKISFWQQQQQQQQGLEKMSR
jgi:hypothetical protein